MSASLPDFPGVSRRGLLSSGAGALLLSATSLARPARAEAPSSGVQVAGLYRRKLGSIEVTSLLDGYIDVGNQLWTGIAPEAVDTAIAEAFLSDPTAIRIGITSYLLNTGDRLILVDSGSADLFGPTAGRFRENLAAAGIEPGQIDDILVTHMHPDHIGALVEGDKAAFPNAGVHVNATDLDYWTSDTNRAAAPEFARPWFDAASVVKFAYGDRLSTFSGATTVLPGIEVEPLPGHTPGHSGFRVSSEGQALLIWGDACGVAAMQFRHPDAGLVFDVDGETGRATRKRMLDMAATDRVLVAAAHLPFPSFGHVARSGDAYAWEPEEWQFL
jgi:glyoxylase-like metal-dependent hydrolase (beta-lactamase superfamily II)